MVLVTQKLKILFFNRLNTRLQTRALHLQITHSLQEVPLPQGLKCHNKTQITCYKEVGKALLLLVVKWSRMVGKRKMFYLGEQAMTSEAKDVRQYHDKSEQPQY